ncbi:uncharacterized protein LOC129777062 [Toxorhynchites rutilus septentrionalis]|uniref:uncharacterized protein LOC129777062 n=1 Tax=Toxorhynchites rutilus septentrionalis TaxID=329112 RepID=UPI002478F1E9|nr:uncharacterized protein LOC129777062 [Toxorhynchites rutilus septentrionalis]XP_055639094.1 uncharacterized protein LOC129777062 [Toxorhynchites rutilus septentrionalis]
MSQAVAEMDNGSCKNMVSNLPLLFAGGYPTSLEKITEAQLEKFIPFMVQCSLGYIQIPTLEEYSEPEWWPGDLEFMIPFSRPKMFVGNWLEKMRELVVICYSFHKCVFLLRFCTDLASYEPATLRFINNYNSTTSLYQRRTNKLLVTFRNENMLYDQAQQTTSRKCLLPKQACSQQPEMQLEQMVEPAFFDIYLCDDCDAELYSYDAYVEHEKMCLAPKTILEESDDDVIFCGSEVLPAPMEFENNYCITSGQNMSSFLLNFNLMSRNSPFPAKATGNNGNSNYSNNPHINILDGSSEKLRRLPRRTRGVVTLSKCTSIPLSSPCGQFLLKSIKSVMSEDYQMERLERLERFCFAPPLTKDGIIVSNRPKWMSRSKLNTNVMISFKRPTDELDHYHSYKFPRRQLSNLCKKRNFLFYNKLLLNRCKPCAINLERLTAQQIVNRNIDIRLKKLNITRTSFSKGIFKQKSSARQFVVDCIDLCSSDEENTETEYGHNSGKPNLENQTHTDVDYVDKTHQLDMNIGCQKELTFDTNSTTDLRIATTMNSFSCTVENKSVDNNMIQQTAPLLHLFSGLKDATASTISPTFLSRSVNMNASSNSIDMIESIYESNHPILSNEESLTEVKENRVNDWLNNTAIATENVIHVQQSHLLLTSAATVASRALSPSSLQNTTTDVTSNNGVAATKSLPSLMKLSKGSNSVDPVIRHRVVTTIDIK